jgi:hypothetical protein
MGTKKAHWPKRCLCGAVYDEESWRALLHRGTVVEEETTLELRNCVCGSTIAIELPQRPAKIAST